MPRPSRLFLTPRQAARAATVGQCAGDPPPLRVVVAAVLTAVTARRHADGHPGEQHDDAAREQRCEPCGWVFQHGYVLDGVPHLA